MNEFHLPVLLIESCENLITNKSGIYFDATLGFGGHTSNFLKILNNDAVVICTDVDLNAFNYCKKTFAEDIRVKLYNFNFSQIDIISKIESIFKFNGIFADLGVSSFQLDNENEGFTFRKEAKLDLRMDKSKVINAADVLNSFSEEDLTKIFFEFGEEKNSKKISSKIVEKRKNKPFRFSTDLVEIISEITPPNFLTKSLSRVFQALRIYVNDELENLKLFLDKSIELLAPNGRIVVIAYHSLEDRIVKEKFKYETLKCICPKNFPICNCNKEQKLKIITKKPIVPTTYEIKNNFRARSSKLRAAERL